MTPVTPSLNLAANHLAKLNFSAYRVRIRDDEEVNMSPLMTSVDMIRYAIGDQVRELGGNDEMVDQIATSAAYAVWIGAAADVERRSAGL
ncbi:hypothetical protein MANY_52940 [Mycolicibacterium anyangense]|uniref:Uncharacterized protein n=2 Tax=Mycolicibacterium anyangense TaxID=1431246 RepID=A0A6N4WIA1_9MYCO|nr:hypothetical protein MANY_52940 [Mycolicibacterium anyangense]